MRIVGRRADGYHDIETLFQFVDWCDWIAVRRRRDSELRLEGAVDGERDLCLRAARWAQERAVAHSAISQRQAAPSRRGGVLPPGADIRLVKRLPMGAGLGGGSSDAATVLAALHALWGVVEALGDWTRASVELGADVPVFLDGRASFAQGRGERLEPVAADTPVVTILVPREHCSTAELYADPDLVRDAKPRGWSPAEAAALVGAAGAAPFENAFEPIARRRPAIAQVLDAARAAGWRAHLSGSGSACVIYGPFEPAHSDAKPGLRDLVGDMPWWSGALENRSALYRARQRLASAASVVA